MDAQELTDIKDLLAEKQQQYTRLEGQLENVEHQIKNDLHFNSFEAAQERIRELEEKESQLSKTYDKKLKRFKEKFPQLVASDD